MQRDELLLGEMIDAAERIQELVKGVTVEQLAVDRQRRDANWSIDLEILHTTATEQLPSFMESLRQALPGVSD